MNPLNTIKGTIIAGVVVAVVIALITADRALNELSLIVWIHVIAGVAWIGLLYYFNFVQVPALAAAAADNAGPGGAGISKYVAPRALLWFRWAAVVTWSTGPLLRIGQLDDAFMLGLGAAADNAILIGIGAWLGTIMLFNVWVLIWPNQKKVHGLVEATAEQITKARRVAFLASRTNVILSMPMLMSMVGTPHTHSFLPLSKATVDATGRHRGRRGARFAEDLGSGDLTAALITRNSAPRPECSRARRPFFAARRGSTRSFADDTRVPALAPQRRRAHRPRRYRVHARGPRAGAPERRAYGAQFPADALRNRDGRGPFRRCGSRHARANSRYA